MRAVRPRGWPAELVLGVFGAGGPAVAVCPLIPALSGPQPVPAAPTVAHVSGMLAGYGVLVLLALMSRAPALGRGVGADVLARWHGRGGRLVIGFA